MRSGSEKQTFSFNVFGARTGPGRAGRPAGRPGTPQNSNFSPQARRNHRPLHACTQLHMHAGTQRNRNRNRNRFAGRHHPQDSNLKRCLNPRPGMICEEFGALDLPREVQKSRDALKAPSRDLHNNCQVFDKQITNETNWTGPQNRAQDSIKMFRNYSQQI